MNLNIYGTDHILGSHY